MVLKTLQEINRDFMAADLAGAQYADLQPVEPVKFVVEPPETIKFRKPKRTKHGQPESDAEYSQRYCTEKKHIIFTNLSAMPFYLAILLLLLSILTSGADSGKPKSVLGYSYFTVLSDSMKDEIPKGSFVLVKETTPYNLEIGDNITFIRDRYDPVTHKIIYIYENCDSSGARGFQTKGVNNTAPDKDIVYESSIIGKVIFVLPGAGTALSYIDANIHIVFIMFGLCMVISFSIRVVYASRKKSRSKR